jgi:hypothetical protein
MSWSTDWGVDFVFMRVVYSNNIYYGNEKGRKI